MGENLSIEQMVRNLLSEAIKCGIVRFNHDNFTDATSPQELTAGDLIGPANLLTRYAADIERRARINFTDGRVRNGKQR